MRRRQQYKESDLDKIYKRLERVIKEYGVVKIRVCHTTSDKREYGTRMIYSNGMCKISYHPGPREDYWGDYRTKMRNYRKEYQTSCFFDNCIDEAEYGKNGIKISVKHILKEMRRHDRSNYYITEVQYGSYFSSRMRLPKI